MTETPESVDQVHGDERPGHGAGPFVEAVVTQLARGIEEPGAGAQQQVEWLTDRLTSILIRLEQGEPASISKELVLDPLLLASIFQNIDLLYEHRYPHADALSMVTLEAVHEAVEREAADPPPSS